MFDPARGQLRPRRRKPLRDRRRLRAKVIGGHRVVPPRVPTVLDEYLDDVDAAFEAAWFEVWKEAGP